MINATLQQDPPYDVGNRYLAPVGVALELDRIDLGGIEGLTELPSGMSAVPGAADHPELGRIKVVVFTVRSAAQTFTTLLPLEEDRDYVRRIRAFVSDAMPNIIMPPSAVVPPDQRRMKTTLRTLPPALEGVIVVTVDSPRAVEWADIIERAIIAHSGLITS